MNRTRTTRLTLAALALIAAATPAGAAAREVAIDVGQGAAEVRGYWTEVRMRSAEPAPLPDLPAAAAGPASTGAGRPTHVPPAGAKDGAPANLLRGTLAGDGARRGASPVADASAAGVRAHGKVFFTVKGGTKPNDYVCSGTAVNSRNRSLVWTAGHCVYDALDGGGKSVNFIFVPAYESGASPYGRWPARKLVTTRQWKRHGNLRYDVGAAIVRRTGGKRLQSVVGARGIGFDQPRKQDYEIFGYPAEAPFDGELEYRCASSRKGTDFPGGRGPSPIRARCDMTAGSSGGGWIAGRTLLSVTSYGYKSQPNRLYGPYLSRTAKKLYKRVRGKGHRHRHGNRHRHRHQRR